jgi:hypothetical protein
VLSYVGLGTSIGQPLEVPILLRSLATGLAILDEDQLPVSFGPDFLMTLDTNLAEQNSFCKIVQIYECDWWNQRKPPDLDRAHIFNKTSLDSCLQTHINQCLSVNVQPQTSTTSATSILHGPSPTHDQRSTRTPHAGEDLSMENPQAAQVCEKCLEYKYILSNTLVDMVNIHTFANMMATSSEAQWNIDMHRASTFHSLHEAAVIKETAATSSGMPSGGAGLSSGIELVRSLAEEEFKRLTNLPPASHKWTWGESLTTSDVQALHRPGTKPGKGVLHSGYDAPLKDGKRAFEDTPPPSMPETEQDGVMADEAQAPPDNTVGINPNLEKMRSRVYDPLGKRRASTLFPYDKLASISGVPKGHNSIPRIPAILTKKNLLLLDEEESLFDDNLEKQDNISQGIVDKRGLEEGSKASPIEDTWPSAHDDIPPATAIEDMWSSGSQADNNARPLEDIWASDSQIADNVQTIGIEDEWPSGDVKEDSPAPVNVPGKGIEDEWPSASQDNSHARGEISSSNARPDLDSPEYRRAPISSSEAPAARPRRFYNGENFDYLQDHMFEMSEEESSEEDYE